MDATGKSRDKLLYEFQKLKQKFDALNSAYTKEIVNRRQVVHDLTERMKELSCHNHISETISNPSLSYNDVLKKIIEFIPRSFQYPRYAKACIRLHSEEYKTSGFKKTKYSLIQNIAINQKIEGEIEVCYSEKLSEAKAKFLKEEEDLLFSIAGRIANFTEKREKEIALKGSEQKYRNLVETISEVIYEITSEGVIKYLSPSIKNILGYSPEELEGKDIFSIVAKEDRPLLKKNIASVRKGVSSFHEYRFISKSGKIRWLQKSTSSIIKRGRGISKIGALTDITDRKKIESELQKSELFYHSIMEASPDAITITDLEGRILMTSPVSLNMFGYKESDEIYQHNIFDFIDAKDLERAQASLIRMFNGEFSGAQEFTGIKSDGRKMDIEVNGQFIKNTEGQPTHLIIVTRDISERKIAEEKLRVSEERFRLISGVSSDYVFSTIVTSDDKLELNWVAGAFENITGYSLEEYKEKGGWVAALHPEDIQIDQNDFANLKANKNVVSELRTLHKNGEIFWVRIYAHPIWDENRNCLTGIYGAVQDITERKQAEAELKKFRTISEMANYGNAIVSFDKKILYVNEAFAKMHGYEINELVGNSISVLHSEEQMDRVNEVIDLLNSQGEFKMEEIARSRKNGSFFPSLTSAIIINDSETSRRLVSMTVIDITNLEEAKEALWKNEKSLNHAQEIAKMGSWELDFDSGKVVWSKNYYRMIGILPFEIESSHEYFLSRVHPDDIYLIDLYHKKVQAERKAYTFDFRLLMPGAKTKWIQCNIEPIFAKNRMIGLRGANIDITEKKESEEKIREQNERLNAIISAIPDMIFVIDMQGIITEYYISDTEKAAVPPSEIIGTDVRNLFGSEAQMHLNNIEVCIQKNKLVAYEYSMSLNNSISYFESRLVPLEKQRVLSFVRDITERKKQDEKINKLSQAIDQSPVAVVITDLDAQIEYVNKAFEKITGYTFDEVKGRNPSLLKSGKTDSHVYENLWETIKSGNNWDGEWLNKKKNDQLYWENITITPVRNEYGMITNYVALKQDITSRKQAEQEIKDLNVNLELKISERTNELKKTNESLMVEIEERKRAEEETKKAREEAERANIAKSEFLSRMSHELRTPMNSILGFAQLLEMGELSANQKKGVGHIMRSGKHLLDLINEVLDISRIEAGHLSISIEPVQISSILKEMMDILRPMAFERKINFEMEGIEDENIFIKADKQRLKQVLLNLLNNAIKYNKTAGSVRIKVQPMPKNHDGNAFVRIAITDTGAGISAKDLPKLFTPFERIGADKTGTEGTGLGLAVVKKLIDAMQGFVGIESVPGEGSTFWVELPMALSHPGAIQKQDSHEELDSRLTKTKGTILYVEDDISNVELVEQIVSLQRPSVRLRTSIHGKQAVKLALEYKPDIILLDLNLPDIHGSEVLRNLKGNEKTKSIPVVIITADAIPQQIKKLIHAGASDYLTKPLDIQAFIGIIDAFIHD